MFRKKYTFIEEVQSHSKSKSIPIRFDVHGTEIVDLPNAQYFISKLLVNFISKFNQFTSSYTRKSFNLSSVLQLEPLQSWKILH